MAKFSSPIGSLVIGEGKLMVVALDEVDLIRDDLAMPARYGLSILLNRRL